MSTTAGILERCSRKQALQQESAALFFLLKRLVPAVVLPRTGVTRA
ncbi:hypothetical protein [Amnibacterium kyonggiense]|nr:hypothetical protein [Amnibacterium kyonggiense]